MIRPAEIPAEDPKKDEVKIEIPDRRDSLSPHEHPDKGFSRWWMLLIGFIVLTVIAGVAFLPIKRPVEKSNGRKVSTRDKKCSRRSWLPYAAISAAGLGTAAYFFPQKEEAFVAPEDHPDEQSSTDGVASNSETQESYQLATTEIISGAVLAIGAIAWYAFGNPFTKIAGAWRKYFPLNTDEQSKGLGPIDARKNEVLVKYLGEGFTPDVDGKKFADQVDEIVNVYSTKLTDPLQKAEMYVKLKAVRKTMLQAKLGEVKQFHEKVINMRTIQCPLNMAGQIVDKAIANKATLGSKSPINMVLAGRDVFMQWSENFLHYVSKEIKREEGFAKKSSTCAAKYDVQKKKMLAAIERVKNDPNLKITEVE